MEAHKFKQFIEQAASLPRHQRAGLAEVLQRAIRQEQVGDLIDVTGAPRACPHCRCVRLHRDGRADGLQRYRCLGCRRSFNALTGTALARLRHRGKWLAYLDCMLQSGTVRRGADLVGIHKNPSFR